MHLILAAAAGLAVGIFCPSLARQLKAEFVKESAAAKSAVNAEAQSAVTSIAKKL